MRQETTIINAEDLFGNLSNPNEFQNMEDGFEKYWEWPEEVGNGYTYLTRFRPDLMLGIGDYELWEDLRLSFNINISSFVQIGFGVSGSVCYTPSYEHDKKDVCLLNPGQSFISYLPEWQGVAKYPAGTRVRAVSIYVNPLLLNTFMEGKYAHIPTGTRDVLNGFNGNHYNHSLPTTPAANLAVHQILSCPYHGPLKRLYLESKALELITYILAELVVDKNGHNKPFTLHSSDIERVREVRNVLINNLENPPSLLELARQVGINKNKLNQGFHQVFGTSVFDYLRIRRLERARELLESKERNVTEAAFDVGYAQQRNFSRAFKKHFGTNPTDHLR